MTCARWEEAMLGAISPRPSRCWRNRRASEFSYLNGGLQPKSFLAGITAVARGDQAAAAAALRRGTAGI